MSSWKKICCPVDFSETSRVALETAAGLARREEAELTLLFVLETPAAVAEFPILPAEFLEQTIREVERKLDRWRTEAEHLRGAPAKAEVVSGSPAHEIVRYAREGGFDLVVVGTHGRTGIRHMVLGSVAERVIREAHCAVLVVRRSGK